MKNLKEYYKQRLLEDIGSHDLMGNIKRAHAAKGTDPSREIGRIAASRFLYVPDPNDPSKPMQVHGIALHPKLAAALAAAAHHGKGIKPEYVKMIKAFIEQHGHFVGGVPLEPAPAGAPAPETFTPAPETFSTKDPSGVLSNIFGSTMSRTRR